MTSFSLTKGHRAARAPGEGRLTFLREFLRSPADLGTCFTSTRALARRIVEGTGLSRARAVVELGPGAGAVTSEVLARIRPSCRFFVVERNPQLALVLRRRFPALNVSVADAARLPALCRRRGLESLDCVISGVPFLLLPEPTQRRILEGVIGVLRPGGRFSQVSYGLESLQPAARRFRRLLEELFGEVRRIGPVLASVPPAFVYRCVKRSPEQTGVDLSNS